MWGGGTIQKTILFNCGQEEKIRWHCTCSSDACWPHDVKFVLYLCQHLIKHNLEFVRQWMCVKICECFWVICVSVSQAWHVILPHSVVSAVKPGYNDISFKWQLVYVRCFEVPSTFSLLTITLYSSVRTTLIYNATIFSPFHDSITKFDCLQENNHYEYFFLVVLLQVNG